MRSRARHFPALGLVLTAVLAFPGELIARDTVHLKSGEVFHGRILRANRDEVSVQLESGGIVSFRASRVDRIKRPRPGGEPEVIVYHTGEPTAAGRQEPRPASPREEAPPAPVMVRPADSQGGRIPEDLSSFPLHARQSTPSLVGPPATGGKAAPWKPFEGKRTEVRHPEGGRQPPEGKQPPGGRPPDPKQQERENPDWRRFHDPQAGFSLTPPVGFKPWSDHRVPSVLQAFIDPLTQANITISVHDTKDSLDRIKDGIVAMLPRKSTAKVVRETKHLVEGPGGFHGWILEMENMVSETTVRQLQLLVKRGGQVVIVTYSASAKSYGTLVRSFDESIASFRVDTALAASRPFEAGPGAPVSAEVEAHLRKPLPPTPRDGPPPPEFVPEPGRPEANRLIDRVDSRLRGAPLRPYTISP